MPPPYGVTPTGFNPKSFQEILEDLKADIRTEFNANMPLTEDTALGESLAIFAERLAELWEGAEAVSAAMDPDKAAGAGLDALGGLTGARRESARFSLVTLRLTGTPGTEVPEGQVVSVAGVGTRFVTVAPALIAPGGTVDVLAQSEEIGPLQAFAGTLTVIETPYGGWDSVTNPADAVPGALVEEDPSFRARRESSLQAAGNAAVPAIAAALKAVEGVLAVTVFENTTGATDVDGLPAGSIEVMVSGGADAEIREAVFASKAAGVRTHGTEEGTVADSEGRLHTLRFSRPGVLPVWVTVDVVVDPAAWPLDGPAQVRAAIASFGDTFPAGRDVVASRIAAEVFKVSGVLDVPVVRIGLAAAPATSVTLPVSVRQVADLDTARIVVNVTNGAP